VVASYSDVTIRVIFKALAQEENLTGFLIIKSEYEIIKILVKARIEIGSMTFDPQHLELPPSFPGRTVGKTLKVLSTFTYPTKIESFFSTDPHFYHRRISSKDTTVSNGENMRFGKVQFDAGHKCRKDNNCYCTLPSDTKIGRQWLSTLNLRKGVSEIDVDLYTTLRTRWKQMLDDEGSKRNTTFQVKTSFHQIYNFTASSTLYWPQVADSKSYHFPPTLVGQYSQLEIKIQNPSDHFLIVQIMSLSYYSEPSVLLDSLNLTDMVHDNNSDAFQIQTLQEAMEHDMIWLRYSLRIHNNECISKKNCKILFLYPREVKSISITYNPLERGKHSSIFLIRNNLTVVETVKLEGSSFVRELSIDSSISNTPSNYLQMHFTRDMLQDCRPGSDPVMTMEKKFMVKNLSPLLAVILYVSIEDSFCGGYGFKIMNCSLMKMLQPNGTQEITIRYSPDFTSSLVTRSFVIVTNVLFNFVINVTIPHDLLADCQALVPRPTWERQLYTLVTIFSAMIFIITICFAYKEANYQWQITIPNGDLLSTLLRAEMTSELKVFDLKSISKDFSPPDSRRTSRRSSSSFYNLTSSLRTLTTRSRRFIRSLVMKSSSLKLFTMTSLRDKIRRMSPFRRPRRRKSISPQQISELAAACSTAVENDDVFVSPPPPPRPKPITTQSSAKRSRQRTPMTSSSLNHRKSSSRSKKVRSVTPLTITDDITTSMTSRKSLVKSCEAAVTSSTTSEVIKPKKRSTPVTSSVERVSSEEDSRVIGKSADQKKESRRKTLSSDKQFSYKMTSSDHSHKDTWRAVTSSTPLPASKEDFEVDSRCWDPVRRPVDQRKKLSPAPCRRENAWKGRSLSTEEQTPPIFSNLQISPDDLLPEYNFSIFSSHDSSKAPPVPQNPKDQEEIPQWSVFGESSFDFVGDIHRSRTRQLLEISQDPQFMRSSASHWGLNPIQPPRSIPVPPGLSRPACKLPLSSYQDPQWPTSNFPTQWKSIMRRSETPEEGLLETNVRRDDVIKNSSTTHAIWSVSNAVTMDENREAVTEDPLGLRSIWDPRKR